MKIEVGDDVELRVIHRGVGGITEGDINLAIADNVIVLGFNVRAEGKATELANREGVEIRYYTVIYQAIEEIEEALKGMLKPEFEEVELGRAEVREVFRSSRVRHHRRLPRAERDHPAQRQGPAAARQRGGRRQPADQLAAAVQGRRGRGPRGLRVRSHARATTATSRSGTSSRPSRCGRSPGADASGRRAEYRAAHRRRPGEPMYVGALELDVLLGDVHSLKQKRSVVRPVVAELRRRFEVAVAEAGHLDLHRRALLGVSVVAADAGHVVDGARPLRAPRRRPPELELLSARRRMIGPED